MQVSRICFQSLFDLWKLWLFWVLPALITRAVQTGPGSKTVTQNTKLPPRCIPILFKLEFLETLFLDNCFLTSVCIHTAPSRKPHKFCQNCKGQLDTSIVFHHLVVHVQPVNRHFDKTCASLWNLITGKKVIYPQGLSFHKLFFWCYAVQLISSFIWFWIQNNMTSLTIYYLEFFTGKHIHRSRNTNLMVTPNPSSSNGFPLCPAQLLSIALLFFKASSSILFLQIQMKKSPEKIFLLVVDVNWAWASELIRLNDQHLLNGCK